MSDVICKTLAQIEPGADDAESPHGTFEVILSDATLDRDGESLKAADWITPLPEHITFDIDHSMNVAGTVGSGVPRIDGDGKMRVSGTYSSRPLAQEVRALVNEGHIRTTSVAFLRKKDAKSGGTKRELLNGAFVAVPANPSAVVLASKAFDLIHADAEHAQEAFDAVRREATAVAVKAGARNSSSDAARIQQIHDLSVELGATCPDADGDGKSVTKAADPDDAETPDEAIVAETADETPDEESDAETAEGGDDPESEEEPEDAKALDEDDLFVKAHLINLRAVAAL